ncbi:MAG: ABC transporter substrate-binding protein [Acidimicrobiia bacterium]
MSRRLAALGVCVALLMVGACSSKSSSSSSGGGSGSTAGRPGVTGKTIKVGGLFSGNNEVGRPYDDTVVGANAYFEMVNGQGGVNGYKIAPIPPKDDQSQLSKQKALAKQLVEQDKVFAVLPVTTNNFAASSYLGQSGTPTFGWNINKEWSDYPNLFGEKGSTLCFGCPESNVAWFLKQINTTKIAVLSYAVPQSSSCADGLAKTAQMYGDQVVYKNTGLVYGFTDVSADAKAIKDNGAQILFTCMDVNGNVKVANELQGSGIKVESPEGYDPSVPAKYGSQVEGFYFRSAFVPFESTGVNAPGMTQFLAAMKKVNKQPSELLLAGWLNAALLVEGLKLAGKDFTQKKVIDSINSIKDWTADGILAPVNWTLIDSATGKRQQPPDGTPDCSAWLQIQGGKFVPILGQPGQPLACTPRNGSIDSATFLPAK